MRTCAHTVTLTIAMTLVAVHAHAVPGSDKDDRDEAAKQVASTWFSSLMRGETAVTTSLSITPFSFDRKDVVKSLSALKNRYDEIVADKGKRDLRPAKIKIGESTETKVEVILIFEDNEGMILEVTPGEAFHVSGFWD